MKAKAYNQPDLSIDSDNALSSRYARNYGVILGVLTSIYLIVLNLSMDEPSTGLRFAKHLIIIPVVWLAIDAYSNRMPEVTAFKSKLGLLFKMGLWTAGVIAAFNIACHLLLGVGFEQFSHDEITAGAVLVDSGFVMFETLVFVMIIGFVILQAYKGKGSPED